MSNIRSPHFGTGREVTYGNVTGKLVENARLPEQSEDRAIDVVLRSVPLPDGLMTRLGRLVSTMADDAPDHVDWLGC
jgi:hypothetical protein